MQTMNKKLTSHQKIVAIMANNRDKDWFYPKDIINIGEGAYYVGYEATARMSELAKKFPDMIETMSDGKYKKRRIRWETMSEWFEDLPTMYRHIIHKTGRTHGVIRKDPHSSTDEPEPAIEFTEFQAKYVGHTTNLASPSVKIEMGKIYTIKMTKLEFAKPILVKVVELGYRKFVYTNLIQFKKDWIVK